MAFSEQFYIRVNEGQQQGPYTYPQLKRLYDRDLIPKEAVYWQDGMDHWHAITDLCGAPMQERQRRLRIKRLFLVMAIVSAAVAIIYLAPIVREGWRETNQHAFSREAAYWKARGYVREELKHNHSTVTFNKFDPAVVSLADRSEATVLLSGLVFGPNGNSTHTEWRVTLRYNPTGREWHLGGH